MTTVVMNQAEFERAQRAAFEAGYEEGFTDRDHQADSSPADSSAYWVSSDEGKAVMAQAITNLSEATP